MEKYLFHIVFLTVSLLLAGSAGAVQLTNFQINGQPVSESTPVTIANATVAADGSVLLNLSGKLTYDAGLQPAGDQPKSYGPPASYDYPIRPAVFSQFGGVPGVFVTDAQACTFPYLKPYSGDLDPKWLTTITVPADQTNRCFAMFTPGDAHAVVLPSGNPFAILTYYDQDYGVVMNHVPAADGSFTRQITISAAQAANGFTLTYQLPDVKYGAGNVTTQVKKAFTLSRVSSAAYSVSDAGTPISARTLTATISAEASDRGSQGKLYAAALLPDGGLFFYDGTGWQPWNGVADISAATVTLGTGQTLTLIKTPIDLSGIKGTSVYLGAGVSLQDVLKNNKSSMVYTVQ